LHATSAREFSLVRAALITLRSDALMEEVSAVICAVLTTPRDTSVEIAADRRALAAVLASRRAVLISARITTPVDLDREIPALRLPKE
jgi:hypothetical protein